MSNPRKGWDQPFDAKALRDVDPSSWTVVPIEVRNGESPEDLRARLEMSGYFMRPKDLDALDQIIGNPFREDDE